MPILNSNDLKKYIHHETEVISLENFGLVVSYSGKIVDEFVDSLVPIRGVDSYNQADILLNQILNKIFILKEFVTGVHINRSMQNQPETLSIFIKEYGKEVLKNIDKDRHKFKLHVSESEISMSKEMLLYLSRLFYEISGPDYPNKELQARLFKMEIDAVVNIGNKLFAPIEAKMFTCPLGDETRVLKRLLSPASLKKYIGIRKSLYFLMGFSFFYDENMKKSSKDKENLGEIFGIGQKFLPVPIILDDLGLDDSFSSWIFHLCILDNRIMQLMESEQTNKYSPKNLSELILKAIFTHQQVYLNRLRNAVNLRLKEISMAIQDGNPIRIEGNIKKHRNGHIYDKTPQFILKIFSGLKLNICLNYNLLKVHYMSGYIAELKSIIKEQREMLLKKEKEFESEHRKRLEERKEKLMERKEKLMERKEKLMERKTRLKLELKFLIKDDSKKKDILEVLKQIDDEIENIDNEIDNLSNQILRINEGMDE